MLTDIEIAKQADIKPISDIAEKLGISADELEFYGKYKAKLPLSLLKNMKQRGRQAHTCNSHKSDARR